MKSRVIYFGGTFDPVHVGHVRIAHALGKAVQASRVLLVPTGVNPLKPPPIASAADRQAMLELAVRDDDLLEICTLELRKSPPIYTIDTIETLRGQLSEGTDIHLAIGADMLADLPKWHRVVELLGMVRLMVACRPPMMLKDIEEALSNLSVVLKMPERKKIRARAVPTPPLEISSSDIRERLSKGLSVELLVKKEVMEYIRRNRLYKRPSEKTKEPFL